MISKNNGLWEERLEDVGISIPKAISNKMWVDGQDKLHYIESMSDKYILNCITFLQKGYFMQGRTKINIPKILIKYKADYLKILNNEIKIRNKV